MKRKLVILLALLTVCCLSVCFFACGGGETDKEYSITYVLDGGVATNPQKYTSKTQTFTLSNPTKLGYTFEGWTFDGQQTPSKQVTVETGSKGDKTFTAKYSVIAYTIAYDYQGGVAEGNPSTYTVEDEFVIHNPTKEGYSFKGWTYEGQTNPQLAVTIKKGTTGDKSYLANYVEYSFSPLKIALFADVQLTTDKNQGSTANAYLALKNHFKYAKSIKADVIMMDGDIVNNAVADYYELFLKAFKGVYGNNEQDYPEFVMNMGNHEWWDTSEKETANAVSMFKQYARIETDNLIKQSAVPYYLDDSATLPTYYKVIKGVPFLVISGDNSSGKIGAELKSEISAWLKEIAELETVKKGGPIYVLYHYPIVDVTYNGEHASEVSVTIDELLKDYPSAIVFTGDTHFNGINERTINQVDYTSINVGTSSYSRAVHSSATGFEYDNVNIGSGKSSAGTMLGDVNFKYEYTPTIMVISMDKPNETLIDRYFTADKPNDTKSVGKTWKIPQISSVNDFVYTDARIENTAWAREIYGKDGLNFQTGKKVRFNVSGSKMIVNFDDVLDFNCAEHYRIEVKDLNNPNAVKYYDYMSNYYKYESKPHTYGYVLEDIPVASGYAVTVTAYDFFDNKSTNTLYSDKADETLLFPDEIDLKTMDTYTDISRRVNYEVKSANSNSSVEYYYKGTKKYPAGMLLNRIIQKDKTNTLENYLSIKDWSKGVITFNAKNENDFELYFTLTLVIDDGGKDRWITDGGVEYRVIVPANSEWTTVKWDLAKQFNITSNIITNLAVKVAVPNGVVDEENGYELSFFVDGIDVTDGMAEIPHEFKFENVLGEGLNRQNLFEATVNNVLTFEYNLVTPSTSPEKSNFQFMIYNGKDWNNYVDYISFNPYLHTSTNNFVKITEQKDGWHKVSVDLSKATVKGDKDLVKDYTLNSIYAMSNRFNCVISLDNFKAEAIPPHSSAFVNTAGHDFDLPNLFNGTLKDVLTFEYKLETPSTGDPSQFAIMFYGENKENRVDYITVFTDDNTSGKSYVTIDAIEDGWYKITVDLAKANIYGTLTGNVTSAYVRASWTNCIVSLDNFEIVK